MLLNVILNFIKDIELFEMCECFCRAVELVVDLELPAEWGQVMEGLEMWKVFTGVLLRLLRDEKGELEVIDTEGCIVELVHIGKETNVLSGFVGQRVLGSWKS